MSNRLAQHGELSLLAIGTALHIQSLPEGAQVSIRALAERFPETEYRIGRALNELEAAGFLRRTRLRTAEGKVVTRTVSYNLPLSTTPPDADPEPPSHPHPDPHPEPDLVLDPHPDLHPEPNLVLDPHPDLGPDPGQGPDPEAEPAPGPPPPGPAPRGDRDRVRESAPAPALREEASRLLAGLRIRDPRLLLAARDVERLVPGVVEWLERGAAPEAVRRALASDVPSDLRNPAGLLAYRLHAAIPPPLPAPDRRPTGTPPPDRPRYPFQTCDGCERAFRSPTPGSHCGDCTARDRKAA
ncbi:helix-turn-helix domain-containing protein [Streptomyces sp. IBSNAI002]|uniref:helix-turn-helix domain-containing protein n=1 Tax=Streptomyces sp. IBSNAI002 TaxID=3457500 RepID=UPI003FD18306